MASIKKAFYFNLIFFCAATLSGCFGTRETDDNAYVLAIGIDKAAGGKNMVTYQLAATQKSGGSENKGSRDRLTIHSIISSSPAETRMLLNSALSRYPSVNHIYIYVFSEEAAREGISPRLSYFIRNREFRESIFLLVVPGSAEEYIRQNKSTMETTIHKYYEKSMLSARNSSYYLPTTFHDFYTRLKNNGGSTYATYSSLNPMTLEEKPFGEKAPEQRSTPYIAGGIPRSGKEKSADFAGIAVFKQDKMVGVLNNAETQAVALLDGSFDRSLLGVVDPLSPEKDTINIAIYLEGVPKVNARFLNDRPTVDIVIKLGAEINSLTSGIEYEAPENRKLLEAQISNLITGQVTGMLLHTQALSTDPAGISLHFRSQFKNTLELDQLDLASLYDQAEIHVKSDVTVHRTGLLWQTTPPKSD